ncbi:MAG: ABC transporter permease [Burkholderiales bacterium]|nr:ABC transporter permease [Burkholderiales bacterium]
MNALSLAWRWFRRDLSAGELGVMAIALVVAVAAMSSVGFFTDRVKQALGSEANHLMAADLVVSSDHAISPELATEADRLGLAQSHTAVFPSMAQSGERFQLASVKAVSAHYPLRGHVHVLRDRQDVTMPGAPKPGTAWADQRLFDALGIQRGGRIQVGNTTLTLTEVLGREPDGATDLYNFVPRLMMNDADLPASGLIQPTSRVRYRLQIAGNADPVERFRLWVKPHIGRGQRVEDIRDARPELRTALERAERFLRLSALMGVFLAAASISLASRRYVERHLDAVALLRTLGLVQPQIMRLFLTQFLIMGILSSVAGVLIGWLAQFGLSAALQGVFDSALPPAGFGPAFGGVAVGLTLLFGFSVPPLLRLRGVPALRVLRRDVLPTGRSHPVFLLGMAALGGLIVWQAADIKLAAIVLGGLIGTVLLAASAAWGLVWAVPRLTLRTAAGWRFGLANVARRRGLSVAQIVALSLGMMALMLLTVVRNDLLSAWQNTIPPDAPNRFIVNIQPEQRAALAQRFADAGLDKPVFAPMIRSRLLKIGNRPVSEAHYETLEAKHLAEREFNLSWGQSERADNHTIAGQSLDEQAAGWAVEEGMAKSLGIQVGDTLLFDIAGTQVAAPVRAIRKINWDSFRVNFFVVGTGALLHDLPASYVTSFHLPEGDDRFVGEIVRNFPSLTVVDVSAVVTEVRHVLDRVLSAVEVVFLFSLAAGLAVLYAATLATHDERKRDAAILRTLGASSRTVRQAVSAELFLIGGLAGVLAAAAALAAGAVAATHLLDLPVRPSWWLLPAGLVLGGLAARYAAAPLLNRVLRTPPLHALR